MLGKEVPILNFFAIIGKGHPSVNKPFHEIHTYGWKSGHPSYVLKSSLHFSVGAALAAHEFMLCG